MLLSILSACSNKDKSPANRYGDTISCEIKPIHIPLTDDNFALESYAVTITGTLDSIHGIIAYNHKLHALDVIETEGSHRIKSIPLQQEGPNGIPGRIISMHFVSEDSIWLYNMERIYLINGKGEVMKRISHQANEYILLENNHAMHTARMTYDKGKDLLYFPVKRNDSVFVEKYAVQQDKPIAYYYLRPSLIATSEHPNYGDLQYPNVHVVGERIIYNYPYESNIYLIDMANGQYSVVGAAGSSVSNQAPECTSKNDYNVWMRHRLENTHFYDVMYLTALDLYVRPFIKGIRYTESVSLEDLFDSREMWLMLFDHDFNIVKEMKLADKRYNMYTPWCVFTDCISIFINNRLSGDPNHESINIDLIYPKRN